MSELQRSFAKAKLAGLPFEPPVPINDLPEDNENETGDELRPLPESSPDDDSSSASSASSASSTGTIRPSPSKHLFARPRGSHTPAKKVLDPLPWNDYFSQELYLKNTKSFETITHHLYILPPLEKAPLLVTHHGAGSSGLSFALFASEIRKLLPNYGVMSLDARGHGETTVELHENATEEANMNLTLETLSHDLFDAIRLTQAHMSWPEDMDLFLIGHSLGGAVVTDLAKTGLLGNAVLGYGVLDVVEGSAIDALQSMQQYLLKRPKTFPSIQSAVDWHVRSRTIRSQESARISVPSLLQKKKSTGTAPSNSSTDTFAWRTDLAQTEPYWSGWFTGLSNKFLTARGGKLLILAGTDRLDKELMIGQMQGKYQLQVFPDAGHFVQEDCAEKTASVVAEFAKRNDRTGLVLPPKVSEQIGKG